MAVKFSNYFRTTIADAGGISAAATTMTLSSVSGYPSLPTADDYFYLTLVRLSDNAKEIVKVTNITGTTATMARAQEGTTALAFVQGDRAENWITAGTLTDLQTENSDDLAAALAALIISTGNIANDAVTTDKIADGAVTSDTLAAAIAGSGLSGGAGTALSVNVDDSTIEINSDTLRVKDGGITATKISGGKLVQMNTAAVRTSGAGAINSGALPYATLFGGSSYGACIVHMRIDNTHSSQNANVLLYVGATLSYWDGTGSDQGNLVHDVLIPDTSIFSGGLQGTAHITFFVPPGYKYILVKNGTDGTPAVATNAHVVYELK